MVQVEEKVELKKMDIQVQTYESGITPNLFDEKLGDKNIKLPNTFKQQVMYMREGKPKDKTPDDYNAKEFDSKGIYIIDKETGNGKKDTYAYDETNEKVFKIPQTKIGNKIYHCTELLEGNDGSSGNGPETSEIQDEAVPVQVEDEYYYEPDLKGFDGNNTQIVYYSNDLNKQVTKLAQEYIAEGKNNIITENGEQYQFHNYGKQQYANIITNANELECWWVWIPRYAYKVNGTDSTEEPISVIYVGLDNKPLNPKYNGILPEGYEVHPAFSQGKELKGIWFSKYEPSYKKPITKHKISENVLAPDMEGFDKENTYIEIYDSTENKFTDEIKLANANLDTVNSSKGWYDYSKQQYANIKTNANGLECWWVWIPRYAYYIMDVESTNELNILNNEGRMDIIFIGLDNKPLDKEKYPDGLPEGYEVHPAFSQGKELKGIWFSKYEPSYKKPITKHKISENVLAPDMEGFDKENTYIEIYDSTENKFTDEIKLANANLDTVNSSKGWYDYSKQQYANIKTNANGLECWWVWIPRYAYYIMDVESTNELNILNNEGRMDIIFIGLDNKPLDKEKYPDGLPEGYTVHPAFTLDEEDGTKKELKGIWFSKYEPSKYEATEN